MATPSPTLFVSYRRTQSAELQRVLQGFQALGVGYFLDREDIEPLDDFPERLRQGIDGSHAMLVWWSLDYAESSVCMAELRRAWQHARRHSSDVGRRIWIVNPESTAHHVFAGELESKNYLIPPRPGAEKEWARNLLERLNALAAEGPFADERRAQPPPKRYGVELRPDTFTGRDAALMRIHSKLHPARIGSSGDAAVQIAGMGGVGKTALVAAYAEEFAAAYPGGIFWLNLAGLESLSAKIAPPSREEAVQGAWLRAVNGALALDPSDGQAVMYEETLPLPPIAVRERLGKFLRDDKPYLWIVDDLPVLSPLDFRLRMFGFLRAPTSSGRTLITTRDTRPAESFALELLDVLPEQDCVRFLTKLRPARDDVERDAMLQLVRQTGGHTQAMMLLGEQVRGSAGGYVVALERLNAHGSLERMEAIAQLLAPELGAKARGIVATFAGSISPLDAAAAELLTLAAVCVPNRSIADRLMLTAFGEEREDEFSAALRTLLRNSLLIRRNETASTFVHPLVAAAALQLLSVDEIPTTERVLIAMNRLAVTMREHHEEACDYAESGAELALRLYGLHSEDTALFLQNLAILIREACHSPHELEEIAALQELAILISEHLLGEADPQTALYVAERNSTAMMAPIIALSYAGLGPDALGLEQFERLPGIEAPIALKPLFPEPSRRTIWNQIGAAIASSDYAGAVESRFGRNAPPLDRTTA